MGESCKELRSSRLNYYGKNMTRLDEADSIFCRPIVGVARGISAG
jgi:hypothetical protein